MFARGLRNTLYVLALGGCGGARSAPAEPAQSTVGPTPSVDVRSLRSPAEAPTVAERRRWTQCSRSFQALERGQRCDHTVEESPGETPDRHDGRSWWARTVEELCGDGLAEHFHASPSELFPLGDALRYGGPMSDEAQTCLKRLRPERLALPSSTDFSVVARWTWLRHIMGPYDDAGLAHLSGLSSLQALDLNATQVGDAGLAHLAGLSSLQTLMLEDTQVGDAGLAHLSGLQSLQTLLLTGTRVGDAGLVHLSGLQSLQNLLLGETQVSDAGLAHLSGLHSLQTLDLSRTQVSDAGLAHLSGLSSLQNLFLGENQVSDAGLAHLSGLHSLQTLDLMDTQVSDAGLAHLSGLRSLQRISLDNTQVSNQCPRALPALRCHGVR